MNKIYSLLAVTLLFSTAVPAYANHDKTPAERAAHIQEKVDHKFEKMDTNKDGSISRAEFENGTKDKFDKADTNKDGSLSKDEVRAKIEAKKEKWKEHKNR